MKLQLDRPLVFFDIEATGLDITNDRIVELTILLSLIHISHSRH